MKINKRKIQLFMANKRMTMTSLATASGIARQTLSVIMAKGTCSPVSAGKIAEGLGCDPADILEEV